MCAPFSFRGHSNVTITLTQSRITHQVLFLVGLLVLVWARTAPVPASLHRMVGSLAGASLYIYLVHWQVLPLVRGLPSVGAVAAAVAAGVLVARLDDRDVGFILGGIRGATYRGLQLSHDTGAAHLALGHLLQLHQLRLLVDRVSVRPGLVGVAEAQEVDHQEPAAGGQADLVGGRRVRHAAAEQGGGDHGLQPDPAPPGAGVPAGPDHDAPAPSRREPAGGSRGAAATGR